MSTQSVACEAPQNDDGFVVELKPEAAAESSNAMLGVVFGLMLCLPLWAGLYLILRAF